ncbi:MAG: hypothetical protein ACRD0B_05950 [Acidimicrobiales bacterium]
MIEGIADALTGIAKLVGGPLSNDARRRGRLASSGYLGIAVGTGAIGLRLRGGLDGALRIATFASRLMVTGPRR